MKFRMNDTISLPGRTALPELWFAFVVAGLLVIASPGISPALAQDDDQAQGETGSAGDQQEDPIQEINPDDTREFANADDIKPEEIPIMDREPFDRLTFNESNDDWVLDIDPIELEGITASTPISPEDREGRLVFTMEKDYPGRRWACPWSSLVKIERYSDLVLQEAEKAMDDGDYGTAFRTLLFLSELDDFGRTAMLKRMLDQCLYEDGHENLEAGNYGEALTAFDALYQRDPRYKVRGARDLLEKITTCINEFIKDKVETGDYESARSLLSSLRLEYGNKVENVIRFWELDMQKRAIARLRDVRRDVEAGDGMQAHEGARDVMYVMPTLPQSVNAYNAVVRQFPFVFVGVTQQAESLDVRRVEDWAARRVGYMVNRWLMEFQKPTDEGGRYLFPAGTVQPIDELGVKFQIELSSRLPEGVPEILTYELAHRLNELATIDSDEYYVPWARLIETIEIIDERSIVFTLKYPHVRPESLLVMPWFAPHDARHNEFFGAYKPTQVDEGQVIFERNDIYEKNAAEQNPRIIERVFRDSTQATEALIRGDLDVVDRVYPGDIARLKAHPNIGVKPYLIPSVHMLIPNPRNEYMDSDHFRRALHFGINRPLVIKDVIAGGRQIDGFEVVSGPFPKGTDVAGELAYAYNNKIEPREHSALLGLVLAQQYVQQENNRLENEGVANPDVQMPTIVLAYPATETIAAACSIIAQQWRAIGVETELKPLPPGITVPEDEDYDLLYVEIQMQEPLIDAYRLFGRNGLAKVIDPTIEQALRNLDAAYSWDRVSKALRRVHQQSANNLAVLPLWQVVDHYAYRRNVFNLGNDIVYLYENLKDWRIDEIEMPEPEEEERP